MKNIKELLACCEYYNINGLENLVNEPYCIEDDLCVVSIGSQGEKLKQNPMFALTSLETEEKSWDARVREDIYEPDEKRVERIFNLLESILKCKKRIDYVVFPELSVPQSLILYIMHLLQQKRISLIAGIEYDIRPVEQEENVTKYVSNQLLCIPAILTPYSGKLTPPDRFAWQAERWSKNRFIS